jgi:decaprenyl-phosphate phosphoribosyltransferase
LTLNSIITLMRVDQYIKNVFIFLPVFFSLQLSNTSLILSSFFAFIAFSMVASAVYIINDLHDIDEDSAHPVKKLRPLASGTISKIHAVIIMMVLLLFGILLFLSLSLKATLITVFYFFMNIAYTFYLKRIAIIDINIISIGFVLRLFVGSSVTNIILSKWIIIMTFLLALFLALSKRRDDVIIFSDTGIKIRKSIDGYNLEFLDAAMSIMASIVIVAYTIYTASFNSEYLYLTTFFVILGILRYLKIALVHKNCGSPTRIVYGDKFMKLILISWIVSFSIILYL